MYLKTYMNNYIGAALTNIWDWREGMGRYSLWQSLAGADLSQTFLSMSSNMETQNARWRLCEDEFLHDIVEALHPVPPTPQISTIPACNPKPNNKCYNT